MNTSSLFAGLRNAKTSEKGIRLREGQYVVRVTRGIYKVTRSQGDAFILEFTVEKSNYEDVKRRMLEALAASNQKYDLVELEKLLPNQIGSSASWYQSLKDIDIGFGSLKKFAADILGVEPTNPEFIEAVEGFMAGVVNDGAINGMLIPVEVLPARKTKNDKDFNDIKWSKIVEAAA